MKSFLALLITVLLPADVAEPSGRPLGDRPRADARPAASAAKSMAREPPAAVMRPADLIALHPKATPSNRIDLGEYGTYGDHGGGIEGTAIERADGTLWMLLRTPRGVFSEVVSQDSGTTWRESRPSKIAASPAPGTLARLSDGRVVLVWNRWAELGADPATGLGRRNEISMAFSRDDGRTWTAPVVVARAPLHETVKVTKARDRTNDISYPYLLEVSTGQLWVTTMRGALRMKIDVSKL